MGRSWCSSQLVEFHICGWKPGMLWCKSWRSESCREVYWGWVRIEDQRLVLVKGLLLCCKGHSLQLQHQIVFGWRNDKREEMHALVHLALKWAVPCSACSSWKWQCFAVAFGGLEKVFSSFDSNFASATAVSSVLLEQLSCKKKQEMCFNSEFHILFSKTAPWLAYLKRS